MVRWVKRVGVNASALLFYLHLAAFNGFDDPLVPHKHSNGRAVGKDRPNVVADFPVLWVDVLSGRDSRPC